MTKENRTYDKRLLPAQLEKLLSGLDGNLSGPEVLDEQLPGPLDQAVQSTGRNFSHPLCPRNKSVIREIERVLQKIEDGEYGICNRCNEDIPIKGLKARPAARYCISCKTQLENEQMLAGS
jgi:DnaK suppressor protein